MKSLSAHIYIGGGGGPSVLFTATTWDATVNSINSLFDTVETSIGSAMDTIYNLAGDFSSKLEDIK